MRSKGRVHYFLILVLDIGIPFAVLTRIFGILRHPLSWPRLDMLTVVQAIGEFLLSAVLFGFFWMLVTWYGADDELLMNATIVKEHNGKSTEHTEQSSAR